MENGMCDGRGALENRKRKYAILLICLVELVLLAVYAWKLAGTGGGEFFLSGSQIYGYGPDGMVYTDILWAEAQNGISELRTQEFDPKKGIYDVTVRYGSTEGGGIVEGFVRTTNNQSIWCDSVTLEAFQNETTFQLWVNDRTDGMGFLFRSGGGELRIDEIVVRTAWNSVLYLVACLLVKMLAFDLIAFGILLRRRLQKHSVVICGVLGITFVCSVGHFTRYLPWGHDLMFHMNRIEGLKDGLLSGAFPVRIQPGWNHGWGYGVSVMYGDLTLILPAFMRICGFTLQTSWKTFVTAVNFATAAISFYSFYKISGDKYKSLLAALLYCTGIYRLACIYIRAAVGEYTVMMFLPLVVLGFWYAFGEDVSDEGYGKKLLAPVLGFTGMIQTHILTCEISALFIVALCIVMAGKVQRRKTFLYLSKIVAVTLLVNLWFIVPLISFMGEELAISRMKEMRDDFRIWGLSIAELFATSPARAYGFTFGENVSLAGKCTFTVGTALWTGAAASLLLLWNRKMARAEAAVITLSFGLISAFMATNLFPYHLVKRCLPLFSRILSKIQFSYRFLGFTGLFFTLTVLFVLMGVREKRIKQYLAVFGLGLSALALFQGMDYQYQILYGGAYQNLYSSAALDTTFVVSGEYLYKDALVDYTGVDQKVTGTGAKISDVTRNSLETDIVCKSLSEGAFVELPLFYYPGYRAVSQTGETCRVSRSENNSRIRVDLPENFEGSIHVFYREPVLWRVCEAISLISCLVLLLYRMYLREKKTGAEDAA